MGSLNICTMGSRNLDLATMNINIMLLKKLLNSNHSAKIIASLVIKTANVVLLFIGGVLLARILKPSDYGIYSYAYSLILLLVAPVDFGLSALTVRETAIGRAKKEYSRIKGVWTWAIKIVTISSLLLISALVVYSMADSSAFNEYKSALFFGLILIPIIPFGNLRGAALRGLDHVILGQLPEFVIRPLMMVVFVIGTISIPNMKLTSTTAMIAFVIASIFAFLAGVVTLYLKTPDEVKNEKPIINGRNWIKDAFPLGLINGMALITQNITTILIGNYLFSSDVAIFKAATQISFLTIMPLTSMNVALSPTYARLFALNEIDKVRNLALKTSNISFLISILLTGTLLLFGEMFIKLAYGFEYLKAYPLLAFILIGQLVNSSVGSVGILLIMTNNQNDYAVGVAISMVTTIIFSIILIPRIGLLGAAIANAISNVLLNIYSWYQVNTKLKINTLAFVGVFRRN